MEFAVITAMPEEYRAVADSLGTETAARVGSLRAGRFTLGGHEFLLVESGMGFHNAAKAAELLVRDGRPDLLVSAGFCGGIDPELMTGDIVVAEEIIIAAEGGFKTVPASLSPTGLDFVARQVKGESRIVGGTFISTSAIRSKRDLAGNLPGACRNRVVEMESGAIAAVAAANNIPLLAIRAVSDSAAEELRFSLDEFCDPDLRRIRIRKVLLTVLRKPRIIPQLVRLSRSSRIAAESLTAALSRLFPAL